MYSLPRRLIGGWESGRDFGVLGFSALDPRMREDDKKGNVWWAKKGVMVLPTLPIFWFIQLLRCLLYPRSRMTVHRQGHPWYGWSWWATDFLLVVIAGIILEKSW